MYVLHVALQGCLKAGDVNYGLTPDTGGHIRFLLDLVAESASRQTIKRIDIATRWFEDYGSTYMTNEERIGEKIRIVRIRTDNPRYLAKEEIHQDVEAFAEKLIAHIEQDGRPDILHAHYADAARVCAIVKQRLGIPFVFTGHSLGIVKQKSMPETKIKGFAERLRAEEIALARANLVLASSRDEAEVQYAGYKAYEPGRIRIIPPGSDTLAFSNAQSTPRVGEELARFLQDPDKPCLLAIARPVAKKNLPGLVEAYGKSKKLRSLANLVLVAGTRDDIDDLDEEGCATLKRILKLIDKYDLYGQVAFPKNHEPKDIPAYYAYARDRGGVFVNPAFNEPFGLTLLEASAVGLPIVATDSGGPNDIVETCNNGILVEPRDPAKIADAILSLLTNREKYNTCAQNSMLAQRFFNWAAHVDRYHDVLARIVRPPVTTRRCEQLLVCDIDNTLVGCDTHYAPFSDWCQRDANLCFGVATGRSFHSALSVLEQARLPQPKVMITSVGSEIYYLNEDGVSYFKDEAWSRQIAEGWNPIAIDDLLSKVPYLTPQGGLEQRSYKLSYFSSGSKQLLNNLRQILAENELSATIIHSHGKYLDILPRGASKGRAVEYVRSKLSIAREQLFVAGDSGNDIEMLRTVRQSIIVSNHSDGLVELPELKHSYVAKRSHAAGVMEGVKYFRSQRARA